MDVPTSCSILFTDSKTVFVFAVGHFLPFAVKIFGFNGKIFTANGRKGRTSKTKVLKSVNKTEQLVGMSKSKREKIQNKNHPTPMASRASLRWLSMSLL